MDTNIAQKIARAFVHGLAFAKGMTTLAQDAKAKMEEGDKWITIGAEPGDDGKKHGGRHVLISGTGEVKAGLSKSAQGKPLGEAVKELKDKAESKKAEEKKSDRGETAREAGLRMQRAGKEAGERAAAKRTKAEIDRKEAMARAKEYRQETKQIVANDLEPSVDKLKKSLAVRPLPSSVHYDLVYMHHLADQIGVMASKLSSLNSRYAENSKEPSAFVVSSHGHTATVTAEAVANLARRSAALAHDFDKPIEERIYGNERAASEIRDNLSKLRGLHQDLLDHIRRIQKLEKPSSSDEEKADQIDRMYAQKGPKEDRLINGPARATEPQSKSVSLSADDKKALKQIKDLVPKIGPVFHQAKSDLGFYSPSEKRGILKEVRFPDAQVTENIKYLNELEGYVKKEKEVRALAKDLDAAVKAGKLTPEDRNIYVRNLKYGFDELTKGIQRGAHAMYDYAERANRGGYVSTLDDQWIREAVRQARGGLSHITWTADKLKASQPSISSESDRVDAMYAQKGSKPKQRIIN